MKDETKTKEAEHGRARRQVGSLGRKCWNQSCDSNWDWGQGRDNRQNAHISLEEGREFTQPTGLWTIGSINV
jgi:uncharacterized protein (UPF0548 family)